MEAPNRTPIHCKSGPDEPIQVIGPGPVGPVVEFVGRIIGGKGGGQVLGWAGAATLDVLDAGSAAADAGALERWLGNVLGPRCVRIRLHGPVGRVIQVIAEVAVGDPAEEA